MSAVAGLSGISLRRFVAVNVLGRLPGTVLTVYAATALLGRPAWVWLAARYRDRLESWLVERTGGTARPGR